MVYVESRRVGRGRLLRVVVLFCGFKQCRETGAERRGFLQGSAGALGLCCVENGICEKSRTPGREVADGTRTSFGPWAALHLNRCHDGKLGTRQGGPGSSGRGGVRWGPPGAHLHAFHLSSASPCPGVEALQTCMGREIGGEMHCLVSPGKRTLRKETKKARPYRFDK
jgi:hypothetical protein